MINRLFSFAFLMTISLPLLLLVTGTAPEPLNTENRRLAARPDLTLSIDGISAAPRMIDTWHDDNFATRDLLASIWQRLSFRLLGTSHHVIVGKQGWLFLRQGLRTDIPLVPLLEDHCGEAPLTRAQLDAWVNALETNWRGAQALGATYLFMVAPNKQSLYSEFLPAATRCSASGRPTRLDQLEARLRAIDGFPYLDLRAVMRKRMRDGTIVFNRTDTHWNGNGALAVYNAIVQRMSTSMAIDDVSTRITVREQASRGGDLSQMAGLLDTATEHKFALNLITPRAKLTGNPFPNLTRDPSRQPATFTQDRADLATAVMFHDSFFAGRARRPVADSFSETRFVWQGSPVLPLDILKAGESDVIIHEMVERNLLQPWF